ncbi:hypothetical protein [Streptoalloteichus hindustanus]|uniref:Uncharacterized protein n=1 Tax=Streptoalloteichus hindustanus TaxID=2017 RepID=A0A1M5FP99_STRHI|nr:hypothetical protein [Streptoalloteichus hindustanus]SHF93249.1 hypothetical protein SAMN05444320_105528 [Streptoalloteichus hindustanus]
MLRISADLFSGRPNPVWEVHDEARVRETLRALRREEGLLTEGAPVAGELGFRGFEIELFTDETAQGFDLGSHLYLPVGRGSRGGRAGEIGERLIGLLDQDGTAAAHDDGLPPLESPLSGFLTTELEWTVAQSFEGSPTVGDVSGGEPEELSPRATCQIEVGRYNPGFWNNNATTLRCNNCYNYASNWRTNNFAQPGFGCGNMYRALTCQELTRASLCDGMHRRFDCFPDSEKPRWLVALVVAPNQDYHWYRYHSEGFWGHKPGRTRATDVDNSNRRITNPETADRGRYTHFCGYFYSCKTQQHRIRGARC